MSKKHETLMAKLMAASESDIWEEAQLEWKVTNLWEEEGGSCDCGHTPITDHLEIHNRLTNATLVVGNVCVKKFFTWDQYDKFFKGIKKLRKDPSVGTPEILLRVPLIERALGDFKLEFLIDTRLTRNLTENQSAFRLRCHKIILDTWDRRRRRR